MKNFKCTRAFIFSAVILFMFSSKAYSDNFEPSLYANESDSFYIETKSFKDMIESLKSFYFSLRDKNGIQEWNMLGLRAKLLFDINFLDIESLKKIGADIESPAGFSVKIKSLDINTDFQKDITDNWVFFIPAKNSNILYKSIHKIITKSINNSTIPTKGQQKQKKTIPELTEIEKDKLLHYKKKDFELYIAKAENFLVFSENKEQALNSLEKSSTPIKNAPYFQNNLEFIKNSNNNDNMIFYYTVNPAQTKDMLDSILKNLPVTIPKQNQKPITDENQSNLLSTGGILSIDKTKLNFISNTTYKNGYLDDTSKKIPAILDATAKNLSIDYYSGLITFYMTLKINFQKIILLLKEVNPTTQIELANLSKKISPKGDYNIENDLIPALTGKLSLLIGSIPAEKKIRDFSTWDGYFSFGILPEKKENIEKLILKIKEEDKSIELKTSDYEKGKLYEIKFMTPEKKENKKNKTKTASPNKPNYLYLYLTESECVISTSKEKLKNITNNNNQTLVKKLNLLSTENEERLYFSFYLNITSVVNYIKTSSIKFLAASFLPYFTNLSDFSINAYKKENSLQEIIQLRLKKTAIP
ncbi:MAG: hypothetical protein OEZ22_03870 [Spirochaetia bacterium]|nr:hypothetical protein [Spirochaetia bacterium]